MLNRLLEEIKRAEDDNDRQFITALARGLSLLSVFKDNQQGLSHNVLCEKTGLPKATVSRLIYTLLRLNFLRQDEQGYYLGKAALELSSAAWARYDIARLAKPHMVKFAEDNQVSVSLAVEEAGEMLYIESIRSPAKLAVQLRVGSTVPIADTAIGRAYFSAQDLSNRLVIKQHLLNSLKNSETAKIACQTLEEHATRYQANNMTISNGEFSSDILAIAVPVYDATAKRYAFSINASVPASAWQEKEFIDVIGPKLHQLAKTLSEL